MLDEEEADPDSDVDIEEDDSTETDLENVLDVFGDEGLPRTQGWYRRVSRFNLSMGLVSKHPWIRSLSSGLRTWLSSQSGRPRRIWESDSKGMSPQTMSWSKMPREQNLFFDVALLACGLKQLKFLDV